MEMKKSVFSVMAMKKLLKQEGAKNVSKGASGELLKRVDEYAKKLGRKAVRNAMLDGRKTVKREDVDIG